jgi:hypothetical protein
MSGRQLFLIDSHQDADRPLISLLAQPGSVFIKGLAAFKHRSLYANIVNDRNAAYYTTCISPIDPFVDLDAIDIKYEPGYEPVIVDGETFVTHGLESHDRQSSNGSLQSSSKGSSSSASPSLLTTRSGANKTSQRQATSQVLSMFTAIPSYVLIAAVFPFAVLIYFSNSAFQSARSSARIRAHHAGRAGIQPGLYSIPLALDNVQRTTDSMYAKMGNSLPEAELSQSDDTESDDAESEESQDEATTAASKKSTTTISSKTRTQHQAKGSTSTNSKRSVSGFPTLALTPEQFAMIESLDAVGFEKYPVHIHLHKHSHAAIIARKPKKAWAEGKVVARHWTDRFEL